jgi:hypothetical protein
MSLSRVVTIMFRNTFTGGDGWTYYPMQVIIDNNCPKCGQKRGEPYPYRFCEDGEWFTVDKWDNPCGHIDTYRDCFIEYKAKMEKMNSDKNAQVSDTTEAEQGTTAG